MSDGHASPDGLAGMSAVALLQRLHLNADSHDRYVAHLQGAAIVSAADLAAAPEADLVAAGWMRGHARRVAMEAQRLRNQAVVQSSSGMERHGSLLDPSPLTTPVSPERRFPAPAGPAQHEGGADAGDAAPAGMTDLTPARTAGLGAVLHAPSSNLQSPAAGPADLSAGGLMQQHFTCFICMEFIVSPRTIACGHSFCKHCVMHWCDVRDDASCPLCRTKMAVDQSGRPMVPPLNKMLDEVSRLAFPARYRAAYRRVHTSVAAGLELRKWQLFTRHPGNAMLVKITCDTLSGGVAIPRALEVAMLRMPRSEFCPPRIDARAAAISCETGPSRIDGLNFNVTAASIQAAVIALLEVKPGNTVLDIGTGSGAIAAWAAALAGPTGGVLGIDSDAKATKYAARNVAIQARKARREAPPTAAPSTQPETTWWVHPGTTAFGTATLIAPTAARGAPRPEQPAAQPESTVESLAAVSSELHQVNLRITAFDPETMQAEATIVSGKVGVRHAVARGTLKFQAADDGKRVEGLKNTRARSGSPPQGRATHERTTQGTTTTQGGGGRSTAATPATDDVRGPRMSTATSRRSLYRIDETGATQRRSPSPTNEAPGLPAARLSTAAGRRSASAEKVAADAASEPLWRRVKRADRAALHLVEDMVYGDAAKQLYHFSSPATIHPADDTTIAGTKLHYVLRLSLGASAQSVTSIDELHTLDGFVGYKDTKGRMIKIAELALTLDDTTRARLNKWGKQAAAAHAAVTVADTPSDAAAARDDDDDAPAPHAATPPPATPSQTASTAPVLVDSSDEDEEDPDEVHWHSLAKGLARVHVAHINAFDLVGAALFQPEGTCRAVHAALQTTAPDDITPTTGIFDRVFVGAEPQSDRDFAMLLRLLRDGGRMVVPFKGELLLLRRNGDDLVSEPKMNVSFGPLAGSVEMMSAFDGVVKELSAAAAAPATTPQPSALRLSSQLRALPSSAPGQRNTRTTADHLYSTMCCDSPIARALSLASKIETTLGDSLRVLDDGVLVFVPSRTASCSSSSPARGAAATTGVRRSTRGPSMAELQNRRGKSQSPPPAPAAAAGTSGDVGLARLKDAFDGQPVRLHGLGCTAVYVLCPCGRPVGLRITSPVQHAPPGENWEGALLLPGRNIKLVKPTVEGLSAGSVPPVPSIAAVPSPTTGSTATATAGRAAPTTDVSCINCNSVFGQKRNIVRETMDWFELPPTSREELQAINAPSNAFVRSATLSRTSVAPAAEQMTSPKMVTASLLGSLDADRITLGPSRFSHYSDRNVRPCRYRLVHCNTCRATVGCTVLGPVHEHDLPTVAPVCGSFVVLLSRVTGLQSAQRLDVLQRVFSAILSGGGSAELDQAPTRRFNPAELMELFASDSEDDASGSDGSGVTSDSDVEHEA